MYEYSARIRKVVDGDTVDLDVDLGFSVHMHQRVRLIGVNCAEHGTIAGDDATAYTKAWFEQYGPDVVLRTVKDRNDKYGRMLGQIAASTRILNDDLITAGHAVYYDGGRRTLTGQQGEADPSTPVP